MNERVIANLDDVREKLGQKAHDALLEFDRGARDRMTPQEFYYSDYPDGSTSIPERYRFDSLLAKVAVPSAREYIETLIRSDLATEPRHTSTGYGLQNYLMNNPAYMQLYSIEGGNERLPQELAARIDAEILLRHPVSSIRKVESGGLRIESPSARGNYSEEFDFVVVALPHNQLKSVVFGGDDLVHAINRHFDYYHYPAHYLRITVQFKVPFWRETLTDSYWMLDRFGGCCLYDESSREPGSTMGVLGWLLGGTDAEELSERDDQQLINAALDSLPDFLAHGRQYFVEGHVHRWINSVNALPSGLVPLSLDRRHQPEPDEHPNLFLVGDYLFDSTLNGVLDSANYVAAWIAAQSTENYQEIK
ncbi:MAG: FAD-dependent oxidoreductase [Pirellulaceae bacterium]